MKRLLLKIAKIAILELINSPEFRDKLNEKLDIPGLDNKQKGEIIFAVCNALADIL